MTPHDREVEFRARAEYARDKQLPAATVEQVWDELPEGEKQVYREIAARKAEGIGHSRVTIDNDRMVRGRELLDR